MKQFRKLVFFVLAIVAFCAAPVLLHAQDSTATGSGGVDSGIFQVIFGFLEGKWPIIGTIGTILFLVSEALGSIKSVAANSVFQLIQNILKGFKKS